MVYRQVAALVGHLGGHDDELARLRRLADHVVKPVVFRQAAYAEAFDDQAVIVIGHKGQQLPPGAGDQLQQAHTAVQGVVKPGGGAAAGGEGIYWKYESTLKALDARLYSAVGAAGELFAVRNELFEAMEPDTLLDDFILSLRITMKGYTIAYCTNAYAIESGSADMREEEKRKVRIAAGGLQSIWRLRPLLNPFRYGILSFQYTSHRVLRWSITPFLLFALFPLNIAILLLGGSTIFYGVLLAMQVLFYGLGYWGYYLSTKQIKNKLLFIPYYFLFMNVNVLKGIRYLKKKKGSGAWEKAKRAEK